MKLLNRQLVAEVSPHSFKAFDLFRDYLENKLSDLKNDITKQTSKLKRKTPSVRLESHRIQFEFNTDILEGLESLSTNLKQQDSTIRKDLISKLKKRNKLIKVADRSPGGWATVREYEEPSLCGSDSEDVKKLKQAETRALKKIKLSHNQPSATVSSNNASDTNCSIFMPPDTSHQGVNYQPSGLSGTFSFSWRTTTNSYSITHRNLFRLRTHRTLPQILPSQ